MERLEVDPGEEGVGVCQRGGDEHEIRREAAEARSRGFAKGRVRSEGAAPFSFEGTVGVVQDGDVWGWGVQGEEVGEVRGQGIVDGGEVGGALGGGQAFVFL